MTDLLYTDVEESLRSSVRGALQRAVEPGGVAELYDSPRDGAPAWSALAGLGLAGLLIPEDLGGAGASAREVAVVLEELGRTVAPAPFLESAVIATSVLLAAGDDQLLPSLAAGEKRAVLVLPWSARAGAWTVPESGPVAPVAGAIGADVFLVPTNDGGTVRLVAHESADVEPLTSLDMSRRLARVTPSGQGRVVAEGDAAVAAVDAGLRAGAALLASEQVGLSQWCLATTVEYARTRVQFARPIGSFQAIKHRLADLYLEVAQAQAAARYAADTLAQDDADAPVAQAVAQSYCSDVAVHAAEEALQLHGGIGMTWEHPVHLYLKRAKSDQLALGTPAVHRADLAVLVDLPQH